MTERDDEVDLGILQAVMEAEQRRGNSATVAVEGERVVAQLTRPLDRDVVESEHDLGPLLAWWPRSLHERDLVDTLSGAVVRSGPPRPWQRLRRRASDGVAGRQRLGWLVDDSRIGRDDTGAPAFTERRARVHVAGSAVEAFTRIDQLITTPASGVLPQWFVDQLAPERDADAWKAWFRERARLDPGDMPNAAWRTRWTETYWRRSVDLSERTWRWVDAEVVHEHGLDVTLELVDGAPIDSLKWMLTAVGAERCGPFGSDV